MTRQANFWDKMYKQISRPLPWESEQIPGEVQRWAKCIPEGARVVDLGCGSGRHANFISHRNDLHVLGLDCSPSAIAQCRETFCRPDKVNLSYEVADIVNFRSTDPFAFAYAYSVLHHISFGSWRSFAQNLRPKLADSAILALVLYSNREQSTSHGYNRIGDFGNEIYHCSPLELIAQLSPEFTLLEFEETTLGSKRVHPAYHALFQAL